MNDHPTQIPASPSWADETAQRLLSRGFLQQGACLLLGAADTGKTSLATALAKFAAEGRPARLASRAKRVGIIDADIGQSHIGPPATVGWTVVDSPQTDFSQLAAGGISFVGDVTPAGHLLQLTAAVTQCFQQASAAADLLIIDTPGFVYGPAASALWWTVQRILQPSLILAVSRSDELKDVLVGLRACDTRIETVKSSLQIPTKSPQERRSYRQKLFDEYFQNGLLYDISLDKVAVQSGRSINIGRLVGLRNSTGVDMAVGVVAQKKNDENVVIIKAPQIDIRQVCCIVVGDISIDIGGERNGNNIR